MNRTIHLGLSLAVVLWAVTGCGSAAEPTTIPAASTPMTRAEVDKALAQAKVLPPESTMGDAATILDRHTIMLTIFAATDCPVRGVTAAEPSPGRLVAEVDSATGTCRGALEPSAWRITSQADLVADGDPKPVTVVKDDTRVEVPVGGARLEG